MIQKVVRQALLFAVLNGINVAVVPSSCAFVILPQNKVTLVPHKKSSRRRRYPWTSTPGIHKSLSFPLFSTSSSSTSSENESQTSPPSSPSFSQQMSDLQSQLLSQTLSRIAIPSLSASLLTFLTFKSSTISIFNFVQTSFHGIDTGTGYEALNLILTDNSNQFIQNAHNFLALTFCFLTSSTFSFLYNNQVTLYEALFDEVSLLISLMEQTALSTEGRSEVYNTLLRCISRYINEDLKVVTTVASKSIALRQSDNENTTIHTYIENNCSREDLPSILVSQRPENDPLENIFFITSVGQPSYIYSTIKLLRQARAKRLAALQRKMPEVNMYLLYILGFTTWITFPIVTAGSSTVGGEALIDIYRNQLSLGVFAMGCVLGIINELKQPEVGSAYNVDYSILGTLMDGLEKELYSRLKQGDIDDSISGVKISSAADMSSDKILISSQNLQFKETDNGKENMNLLDTGNSTSTKEAKISISRRIWRKIKDRKSKRKG